MCRLVAVIKPNNLTAAQEVSLKNMFTHILYANSFGNVDGTGVMFQTHNEQQDGTQVGGHKRAVPSPDFINGRWYDKTFLPNWNRMQFIGGHTRFSTVGGNSDQNSHPFQHGNITFMQNGTAAVQSDKALVYGVMSPHEVDSENVCWAINEQGLDKTLENYEGDGVFMWIDSDTNQFNILKNNMRQLHIAKVHGMEAYVIATEEYVLELAALRAKVVLEEIAPVQNDVLHTWNQDGSKLETKKEIDTMKWNYQTTYATTTSKTSRKRATGRTYTVNRGGSVTVTENKAKGNVVQMGGHSAKKAQASAQV